MKIFGLYIGKYKQPKIKYRDFHDFTLQDYMTIMSCVRESRDGCMMDTERFKSRNKLFLKLFGKLKELREEINLILNR